MKAFVCLVCACYLFISGRAQISSLEISRDKTTSLIFPFAIKHVDRGTKDVLVQAVKEADNILLVKAATENFRETNLSVVTEDGNVYSFLVNFENNPKEWIFYLPSHTTKNVVTYANGILDNPRTVSGIKNHNWEVEARIIGIYIKDNVIYYQLRLTNTSSIDYDVDVLRFYISDKKKSNRTATQENESKPLYVAGNISQVKGNSQNVAVVALEKFTISDAKYLAVQVIEKNGGRHLLLKVNNHKIIKATVLPDLR